MRSRLSTEVLRKLQHSVRCQQSVQSGVERLRTTIPARPTTRYVKATVWRQWSAPQLSWARTSVSVARPRRCSETRSRACVSIRCAHGRTTVPPPRVAVVASATADYVSATPAFKASGARLTSAAWMLWRCCRSWRVQAEIYITGQAAGQTAQNRVPLRAGTTVILAGGRSCVIAPVDESRS